MGIEYLLIVLIGLMLIAALIAVEAKDLLSSVISLGAAGFALSVVDLLLGAPDLAITQVVVEVIALVLLIRVVVTREDTSEPTRRDGLRIGAALLAGGVVLAAAFLAFGGMGGEGTVPPLGEPRFAEPDEHAVRPVAADYVEKAAEETGSANAVMGVLLDYRAYDTLGEATVIFVSVLGTYAMLRRIGRRREEPTP
jgi:multisubunit Na+/H+ antiporter MnhB subunit